MSKIGEGKLVMIIDDDVKIRNLLEVFLSGQLGFQVITEENGLESLRKMRETRPDLVITDFNMIGMTGLEIIQAMRDLPDLKKIPVILISGTHVVAEEAKKQNIPFLPKPFDLETLKTTMKKVLGTN